MAPPPPSSYSQLCKKHSVARHHVLQTSSQAEWPSHLSSSLINFTGATLPLNFETVSLMYSFFLVGPPISDSPSTMSPCFQWWSQPIIFWIDYEFAPCHTCFTVGYYFSREGEAFPMHIFIYVSLLVVQWYYEVFSRKRFYVLINLTHTLWCYEKPNFSISFYL